MSRAEVIDLARERDRRRLDDEEAELDLRAAAGYALSRRAPLHLVEQVADMLRAHGVQLPSFGARPGGAL